MNIRFDWPPNIDQIEETLPGTRKRIGVVFCYGDTIYNPGKQILKPWILDHEKVHCQRQTDVKAWWTAYLADMSFRYREELPAHIAEAKSFASMHHDRNQRMQYISMVAQKLSGPLYGRMVSFEAARKILREA